MLGGATDDSPDFRTGQRVVAFQQLCIAVDDVKWRTYLMADRDEVAGLRLVGSLGRDLGALKLGQGRRMGCVRRGHDPPGRGSVAI